MWGQAWRRALLAGEQQGGGENAACAGLWEVRVGEGEEEGEGGGFSTCRSLWGGGRRKEGCDPVPYPPSAH